VKLTLLMLAGSMALAQAPVGVSPAAVNASSQTLTFTFTDPNGYQDLGVVNILVNNFLDGRHACYLAYSQPSNSLFLVDDAGDGGGPFAGSAVINTAGSIQNSQCTVSWGSAPAGRSGNNLTLTLTIALNGSFAGNRIVYMAAGNVSGSNSGWQALGVWQAPGGTQSTTTAVTGMSPASGSGFGPAAFTFAFSDIEGFQDLGVLNILINNFIDGRHACYLAYARPGNILYLVDDAGDAGGPFAGSAVLNAAGSIQNSQCVVSWGGAPVTGSGNSLSLALNIQFTAAFAGDRVFYLAARDANGANNTDWQAMGTWAVEGSTLQSTLYVAPNGNDTWSGGLAAPNATNTDGPLATFEHARAVVQSLNKTGLTQVSVQFRGGTYFLPATEKLTGADSGTASTEIVYQNYPGETPAISGGVRVGNWVNVSGNTWKTTLPASTQYFENLFYNGVRRLRPRLGGALGTYYRYVGPIYLSGPAPPAAPPDPDCSVYFAGSGWECYDRFQYNPADPIVNTWKNLAPPAGNPCGQPAGNPALAGDIELVNFEQYSVSKLRVSCVDSANQIVYLTGDTATEADHPTAHGFIPHHRYLIENVEDELSQPGQWFLDRSATPWALTYLANPGENPNTDTVIIPQLTQVLVASNLEYVTFQGLTLEHDNYTMPATGYDGTSDIIAGVSFQNSQHITFDSSIVTETSGVALEFISCIDKTSPNWCVSNSTGGVAANNLIQNSAFYDLAADAIRIGVPGKPTDTNANVPQFNTVQNTVVEGYGRVYASSKGITQGQGHDNLYTHNDVYDGYKGAIKVCYCANSDVNPPFTNNNVISFNHVYNLFQGLMNDSGSLYFGVGTPSPPSSGTGNKMLNNKVHDVSDASALDADGYGGDGLYADDFSGQVDMENNLVYRVSGNAVSFSGPRAGPNQSSTVKNNILAFARQSLLNAYDPYSFNTVPPLPMFFTASNNLFYFDRNSAESFYVQGGCTYPGAITYTAYQQWTSNLYWRTDGGFAADPQAFHVQRSLDANNGCGNQKLWTYYTFAGWQGLGEEAQGLVQNPGFANPAYPADDYSLSKGSAGVGFVVFDPSQAGRSNPVIHPRAVPATFPTKSFNPATDY